MFVVLQMIIAALLVCVPSMFAEIPDDTVVMDPLVTLWRGRSGNLQCSFRGSPKAVYWMKGGTLSTASHLVTWYNNQQSGPGLVEARFSIAADYSLIIRAVSIPDQGRYFCKVSNHNGFLIHGFTDLKIAAEPAKPFPTIAQCSNNLASVSRQNCSLQVLKGIAVNITCQVHYFLPRISLSWKHGSLVVKSTFSDLSNNPDGTMNISVTTSGLPDDIPYICTASGFAVGEAEKMASVLLVPQETPVIPRSLQTLEPLSDVTTEPPTLSQPASSKIGLWIGVPLAVAVVLVVVILIVCKLRNKCEAESSNIRVRYAKVSQHETNIATTDLISYAELVKLVHLGTGEDYFQKMRKLVNRLLSNDCDDGERNQIDLSEPSEQTLYDALCKWKEQCDKKEQTQKLFTAMETAGLTNVAKSLKAYRNITTYQVHVDVIQDVSWNIDNIGKLKRFGSHLGLSEDLLSNINVGSRRELIQTVKEMLYDWNKNATDVNNNVLLCLALETAGFPDVSKTVFQDDNMKRGITEGEMKEFACRLTLRHCRKLGNIAGLSEEQILDYNEENHTEIAWFDTFSILWDWKTKRNENTSDERNALHQACLKAGRGDLADLIFVSETTDGTSENSQEVAQHEHCEDSDTTPVVQSSQDKENTLLLDDTDREVYLVECVNIAFRLFMDDIFPVIHALGVDGHQLFQGKMRYNSLNVTTGTNRLLKNIFFEDPKRSTLSKHVIFHKLTDAGYKDVAKATFIGHQLISIGDLRSIARRVSGAIYEPFAKQLDVSPKYVKLCEREYGYLSIFHMLEHWNVNTHGDPNTRQSALSKTLRQLEHTELADDIRSGKIESDDLSTITNRITRTYAVKLGLALGLNQNETDNCADERGNNDMMRVLFHWQNKVHPPTYNYQTALCDALHEMNSSSVACEIMRGEHRKKDEDVRNLDFIAQRIHPDQIEVLRKVLQFNVDVSKYKTRGGIPQMLKDWRKKWSKSKCSQTNRRELSDKLLTAGFYELALEVMTRLAVK